MITLLVLSGIILVTLGGVLWPVWKGWRRPWALDAPRGEVEILRQEQVTALDALRDLAMDYRMGNLSREDYRALAIPLQQRARRALELQQALALENTKLKQPALVALDRQLEEAIRAARKVTAPVPVPPAAPVTPGSASPPAALPQSQGFCPQCGAPVTASFRFCAACGAELPEVLPARGRNGAPQARPVPAAKRAPAGSSPEVASSPTGEGSGRRWLWWIGGVVALVWVVGIVWIYVQGRAVQENQTPVATLPGVPIQALTPLDGVFFLGEPNGLRISQDGVNWRSLPLEDDVRGIVPLDSDSTQLLAAGQKGLWRSQDGGQSWQLAETSPAGLVVVALAPDPGTPGRLLAAEPDRLYQSQDGGQSWQLVADSLPGRVRALVAGPGMIFLGTDQGVYRSVDGGASWSNLNGVVNGAIASTDVRALAYDSTNGILYAGTPAGLSFMNLGAPGGWGQRALRASVTAVALGPGEAPGSAPVLWVGAGDGRLFRSTDRGVSWR